MWLLLDAGNTRLKWRRTDGHQLLDGGSVPIDAAHAEDQLKAVLLSHAATGRVIASNVAGIATAGIIERVAHETLGLDVEFVIATAEFQGLRNGYATPASLGADRWLAMIGARAIAKGPLCIVDCGTAVTLDWIDADGVHLGGMIIPGRRLMRECLITGTRQVRPTQETDALPFSPLGNDTQSCISAGTVASVVGMVEHAVRTMGGCEAVNCLVSGGDGAAFASHLAVPHLMVPDLTFHGLLAVGNG